MSPQVGELAPDFILKDQFGQDTSLATVRSGKAVLLVFYPFAFSGICTGELCEIRDDISRFANSKVQVMGISCDTMYSQRAWAEEQNYDFPLLSDFWPHGAVSKAYDVFLEPAGLSIRGTFLIDTQGVVRWSLVNGPGEARDFGGFHEALEAL